MQENLTLTKNIKTKFFISLFLLFLLSVIIYMAVNSSKSKSLRKEEELISADYQYLNSLNIDATRSLTVKKEYSKDFYVYAMKVANLYNDNSNELIYKKDESLYISDKEGNIIYECFAGKEDNGNEKILVEDINMDGIPEIITTGYREETSFEKIKKLGEGSYSVGVRDENDYKVRIQFISRYAPERVNATIEELKKIVLIEKINENEILLTKEDYNRITDRDYSLKIFDNKCSLISKYLISNPSSGISSLFSIENNSSTKSLLLGIETVFPHSFFLFKDNALNFTEEKKYTDLIKFKEAEEKYPIGMDKTLKFKIGANAIIDDLDNDGNKEIVVKSSDARYGFPSPTTIFVLNGTNGEMLAKYVYETWINSITIGDLSGDGKKEIIVSGHYNSPFSVLIFK